MGIESIKTNVHRGGLSMLGRENVSAITNEIIAKLNSRLNEFPYKILTPAQFRASPYQHHLLCINGNYIVLTSESKWHNTELTLHRLCNIYNISHLLNRQLTDMLKDTNEQLYQRVEKIHDLLMLGKTINKQISNNFGVSHVTYEEGRLAGHNIFVSRWNTSWTRSRTQRLFNESMSILDNFKHTFGMDTPSSSAPPPYSASLEVPMASLAPVVPARKI